MKKVSLLIHHHTVAFQDDKGIWMQSFIAEWIINLSKYFDQIGLLFHCSVEKKAAQDILVENNKINLHSLGMPGKYYDAVNKRLRIKKVIKTIDNKYDVFLIRGITPRQSLVINNVNVRYAKKYYLLVGSQKFDLTTLRITSISELISIFFKFYRRHQFRKLIKNMSLLVNGTNLVSKNDYEKQPVFIPTNTISEKYYYKNFRRSKNNPIKLFYCGRIEANKGIVELLNALKALNELGYSTNLEVVGNFCSKNFLYEVEDFVKTNGLERNISFNGFVEFGEALFEYYRSSDYFILPSYSEGFPHVIWEAAANSCPIIATDIGGIGDVIKNRYHGLLIKPKESNAIVQAVIELEQNEKLKEKIIKNAYAESTKYSVQKCAKLLADFIFKDVQFD